MNFAILTNVLTMILCVAVLIQSIRMMRSLKRVKDGALAQVVSALDAATDQARRVLTDMKATLGKDCAENARLVEGARELRDELSLMISLADAAAERVVDAVATANGIRADDGEDAPERENAVAEAVA